MFKNRAEKVAAVLKKAGLIAVINDVKPRKGAFCVTIGSKKVIELLDLPRPFTKLKSMDVEAVVSAAIQN